MLCLQKVDVISVRWDATSVPRRPNRASARATAAWHALALAGAAALAGLTIGSARWSLSSLAVIAALTIASELTSVETGSTKLKISGSFLGIMLAAVLLGGAPAALVGLSSIGIGWLRSREAPHYLMNNLASYAWFPLLGGLFFHLAVRLAHVGPDAVSYYLLVFITFVVALAMNFVLAAGYQCRLDGTRISDKAREALAPILASQLFSALLTLAAVYVAVQLGTVGLALFGLVLVVFQYLVGELLASKRRGDELRQIAITDGLTGLANRERFNTQLGEEIRAAEAAGQPVAVMLIDLDRFKEINDTLGHHYGDIVLRELGPRLSACVGTDGLVARLGGDEFAVLPRSRTEDPNALNLVADRLLACVRRPFSVDELTLDVSASIGIARFPRDGRSTDVLLRHADVAMYAAKREQSGAKLYAAEHDHHSVRRLSVLGDVRRGLDRGELIVHYQPKVRLDDLKVGGAEALVRWQHPKLGLLLPSEFVPAVEQTRLIGPLTKHVLEQAISQCARWRGRGHDMTVAVNLSMRNLLDRNLPREVKRMLAVHGLRPEALELEITEGMIMSDPDRAIATVLDLSALGIRLSVDDFGTGYSSLANLKRLPIDELKIDRSFVTPMLKDESDLIIVRSTINLAHDLGLTVIAEGVEDEPTLECLAALGCDLAQGFHFARALPADPFAEWLTEADHGLLLGGPGAVRSRTQQ